MICERCHGTGMVRELADELPIEVLVPCGDCGGCGCTACPSQAARSVVDSHCCEGERAQPGGTSAIADPV